MPNDREGSLARGRPHYKHRGQLLSPAPGKWGKFDGNGLFIGFSPPGKLKPAKSDPKVSFSLLIHNSKNCM